MSYTVISERTVNNLIITVNKMMQEGWKPVGGITVVPQMISGGYAQSMVKESEE